MYDRCCNVRPNVRELDIRDDSILAICWENAPEILIGVVINVLETLRLTFAAEEAGDLKPDIRRP